jgi:hypothetical protein
VHALHRTCSRGRCDTCYLLRTPGDNPDPDPSVGVRRVKSLRAMQTLRAMRAPRGRGVNQRLIHPARCADEAADSRGGAVCTSTRRECGGRRREIILSRILRKRRGRRRLCSARNKTGAIEVVRFGWVTSISSTSIIIRTYCRVLAGGRENHGRVGKKSVVRVVTAVTIGKVGGRGRAWRWERGHETGRSEGRRGRMGLYTRKYRITCM